MNVIFDDVRIDEAFVDWELMLRLARTDHLDTLTHQHLLELRRAIGRYSIHLPNGAGVGRASLAFHAGSSIACRAEHLQEPRSFAFDVPPSCREMAAKVQKRMLPWLIDNM